jgi:Asp-tRNA(Asn)/Glu-tRNA(Gln) amidotransferase A subunit family amidase
MSGGLAELGAAEAILLLARRELTAEALVQDCLERIAAVDGALGAFEHLDPEAALAAARRIDGLAARPPLGGLPIAVKDIFDTADLPTERGAEAFRGRRPASDAEAVARLRAAGAVVLGKTVTTELAFYRPGKTRNPHDPARTPGGSSSGSAAAVAARLAPAALGSQTAGSVIRPASFCGVVGFKPTFGAVSMAGVSPFAPSLDTFGLFVRDVEALPLLLRAAGVPLRTPDLRAPPRLALCRTEQWRLADDASRAAVEETASALARAGAPVDDSDALHPFPESSLLDPFPESSGLAAAQRTIMAGEAARTLREIRDLYGPSLSPVLREFLEEGDRVTPERENAARALAHRVRTTSLPRVFSRFDALLTPSAVGEAPVGLESTGDPAMNRIWTLLGTPCVSIPVARGPAGLPIGVQLVGAPGKDAELVAAAAWVMTALAGGADRQSRGG